MCDNFVRHSHGLRRFYDPMAGKFGLSVPRAADKLVGAVSPALQYLGFALVQDLTYFNFRMTC